MLLDLELVLAYWRHDGSELDRDTKFVEVEKYEYRYMTGIVFVEPVGGSRKPSPIPLWREDNISSSWGMVGEYAV